MDRSMDRLSDTLSSTLVESSRSLALWRQIISAAAGGPEYDYRVTSVVYPAGADSLAYILT